MLKRLKLKVGIGNLLIGMSSFAATNSDFQWEETGTLFMKSITGPVAMIVSTVIVVVALFGYYFSDGQGMASRAIRLVAILSGVASAANLVRNVFKMSGGVTF